MNSSQMSVTGSRAEFITEDYPNIKYGRGGGCFVSHAKGAVFLLLAAAAVVLTGLLVYYYAPCPRAREFVSSLSLEDQEAASDGGHEGAEGEGRRLPSGIKPSSYNLCIRTLFDANFTFDGRVYIEVTVASDAKNLRSVTLHTGKDLKIVQSDVVVFKTSPDHQADSYSCESGPTISNETMEENVPIQYQSFENSSDFYIIHFRGEGLEAGGNYTLSIPFEGKLKENLYGFYRSSFKDSMTGEKRWVAVTQFEATHAREAFPCFDEPALKATFAVSLARPSSGFSLSNMRIRSSQPSTVGPKGWIWDHYEPSPPMSSYLLAFLVVPDSKSMQQHRITTQNSAMSPGTLGGNNISFSIWTRPGYNNSSEYALNLGMRVLHFYEKYFGVNYPMTKMEMVAVPDFGAGAMENWGLVTYRESVLLYDPGKDSSSQKVDVALTVAHELAHQWFGNLVTMQWWKDLWLNEGFATYVEYIGANEVEPEWAMLDRFVTEELQITMAYDSLRSTHAVSPGNSTIADSAAIAELFDSVSYGKGSCLVRMLNHTLGERIFRKGLTSYLKKWSFSNAEQDDLWEALTEAAQSGGKETNMLPSGLSVKDVMDTWTLQEGFPVVSVIRNYTDGSARVSQERFLMDPKAKAASEGKEGAAAAGAEDDAAPPPKEKWHIPVTYTSAAERSFHSTKPRFWLLSGEGDHELPKGSFPGAAQWVVFNVQETGFYRVNYDEHNWRLLSNALMSNDSGVGKVPSGAEGRLPDVTKAQIIDDALSLARAGRLNYSIALGVTTFLSKETEFVPWTAALGSFLFLDKVLLHTSHYGMLEQYLLKLLEPIFMALHEKTDIASLNQKLLRSMIMKWACHLNHEECLARSIRLFKEWMNSSDPNTNNPVPAEDRRVVYCTAVRKGSSREWLFLWKRFKVSTNDSSAAEVMLPALACTREPWIISKLLSELLEKENEKRKIRLQDIYIALRALSRNPVASKIFFYYIRNNWESLHRRYGGSSIVLGELVKAGLSGLSSGKDLQEVKDFRKRNARKFRFATQDLDQAEESLSDRVLWQKKNLEEVSTWLSGQVASWDSDATDM